MDKNTETIAIKLVWAVLAENLRRIAVALLERASSCWAIDLAHDYRREITYFARAMRGPLERF
jgi:hypothetical protein